MGKSAIDATINNEIFRNDFSQVIALRRDLATLSPVRLKVLSSEYKAGQVLCYNSVSGQYEKYSTASGSYDALCVLFERVRADEQSATGGALARAIFAGHLYKDALTDYDSGAKGDLNASEYVTADGVTIVKF